MNESTALLMIPGRLYFELYHGRSDPEADMDDWGDPGPILGPLSHVHGTYLRNLRLVEPDGRGVHFDYEGGLLYYDGVYYGDWSVFRATPETLEHPYFRGRRVEPPDPNKARKPEKETNMKPLPHLPATCSYQARVIQQHDVLRPGYDHISVILVEDQNRYIAWTVNRVDKSYHLGKYNHQLDDAMKSFIRKVMVHENIELDDSSGTLSSPRSRLMIAYQARFHEMGLSEESYRISAVGDSAVEVWVYDEVPPYMINSLLYPPHEIPMRLQSIASVHKGGLQGVLLTYKKNSEDDTDVDAGLQFSAKKSV